MATINGVGVNFALTGHGVTGTNIGTLYLQSVDRSATADRVEVRDQNGVEVSHVIYNPGKKATLEYIPTGATTANALSATKIPLIGAQVTITDTNTADPGLAETTWEVMDSKIGRSNTGVAKVSLSLSLNAGIAAFGV